MALEPASEFPTQTTPPNADYPDGGPQDITVSGDNTGTPWNALTIGDIWGLLQGLLQRANINASGDPDTAVTSQYIQALGQVCGRSEGSTTEIVAANADFRGAEFIETNGYAARGDGGHAIWFSTGNTEPGEIPGGGSDPSLGGATKFEEGKIYDAYGTEFQLLGNVRNPLQFGALNNGSAVPADVTATTTAVQNCYASLQFAGTGGMVWFANGTYRMDAQINVPDRVATRGESVHGVLVSFEGALVGSFPNGFCFYAAGSAAVIPDLGGNVDAGDAAVSFAGPHTLVAGDVFAILDPTDSSLSPAQLFYRAGEFVEVGRVDGPNDITAARELFAGYAAATVNVAKVTPVRVGFESMSIRGLTNDTTTGLIGIQFGRDSYVRDLHLSGTQADSALHVDRSFNTDIANIRGVDFENPAPSFRHMVGVWNSQRTRVARLAGSSGQAFLATGGKNTAWAVPCRDVMLTRSFCDDVLFNDASVEIGGDTEYWRVTDCTLGGIRIGGDIGAVDDCTLRGAGALGVASEAGAAIRMREAHGHDFLFSDCRIRATRDAGVGVGLVDLADSTAALIREGEIRFVGGVVDMRDYAGVMVNAQTLSANPGAVPRLAFEGVRFKGPDAVAANVNIRAVVAGTGWRSVKAMSCNSHRVNFAVEGAEDVDFIGCAIDSASLSGISVFGTFNAGYAEQRVNVSACRIRNCGFAGISLGDATGTAVVRARVNGCESINNNQSAGGAANASVRLNTVDTAILQSNVMGDDQAAPTQTASYSADSVVNLVVAETVSIGSLAPDLTSVTNLNEWATKDVDNDFVTSSGRLGVGGGTAALAGTGADDLVVGNGFNNRGITIRPSAFGVSRLVMGDSNDADLFRMEGDHASGRLDFYANGGRNLRLFDDALQFARLYTDDTTELVPGDVSFNNFNGSPSVASAKGSESIIEVEVDLDAATPVASDPFIIVDIPGGAYDEDPICIASTSGDGAVRWKASAASPSTVSIAPTEDIGIGSFRISVLIVGTRP